MLLTLPTACGTKSSSDMIKFYRSLTIPLKRFRKGSALARHLKGMKKAVAEGKVKDAIRLVLQWKGRVDIEYLTLVMGLRPSKVTQALREMITDGEIAEEEW